MIRQSLNQELESVQPRKEPVQARSRERFERILAAATRLIGEKGVDAVPMSEIAAAADISVASLYQYFPDKAAIIATLAERFAVAGQACVRSVFEAVEQPADMITAIEAMADDYFEFFRTVPGSRAIWQATQSDARLQAMDDDDMDRHAATLAAAFRKVRPQMSKADALRLGRLFTIIVGTTVRHASAMPPREARAMVDECKQIVLIPGIERALGQAR